MFEKPIELSFVNMNMTLFISITVFCGHDNILLNSAHIPSECREYFAKYCEVPQIIVMDLNYVMNFGGKLFVLSRSTIVINVSTLPSLPICPLLLP
jgi:hypothetical protein